MDLVCHSFHSDYSPLISTHYKSLSRIGSSGSLDFRELCSNTVQDTSPNKTIARNQKRSRTRFIEDQIKTQAFDQNPYQVMLPNKNLL